MAVQHVCDRCGNELNADPYQRGLVARLRQPILSFLAVKPVKAGFNDMWELNTSELDLCQQCTREFFKFVKTKPKK